MNIRVLAEALADKLDDRQSQELLHHPSYTRDGFIKMLEEVIRAHVLSMSWTMEKPTQPGWYWSRWRGTLEVVKVAWDKDKGTLTDQADPLFRALSDEFYDKYEWAGPLEPPP